MSECVRYLIRFSDTLSLAKEDIHNLRKIRYELRKIVVRLEHDNLSLTVNIEEMHTFFEKETKKIRELEMQIAETIAKIKGLEKG